LRKLAQALLEENGYRVLAAESGVEALKIAEKEQERIHLLLTDVIMPGMNGRALAERLAPQHKGLRVLYMSGYTHTAIAEHAVLESGTYLLQKPFTEEALLQKVCEVLCADAPGKSASKQAPVLAGSDAR